MTKREYNFFCNICGYFPTILTFDLNKKTVFDISIGDVEEPERETAKDSVDADCFWANLTKEIIARGLIPSGQKNPYEVKPSYTFWAPWIGRQTRKSNLLQNTEYMKCPSKRKRKVNVQKDNAADMKDMDIGEDYLIDLISKKDKKVIGNICRSISLSARGSSSDMLNRI